MVKIMSNVDIPNRSLVLLKTLVERFISEGTPVGSAKLREVSGLSLSPATIRNVMSDLEERGYLHSPHTSAGRIPTSRGYRLFVDSLLKIRPLDEEAVSSIRSELNPDKTAAELVQSASAALATITSQAGVVTVPRRETNQLRQIEFLPLSDSRVLVILVINEKEVQNRIIHTQRTYTEDELRTAAEMVNHRYSGSLLSEVKSRIVSEMEETKNYIDDYLSSALELASQALNEEKATDDDYIVAGEAQLMGNASIEEMANLRELFDSFGKKRDLLHLLERCSQAEGVQIFIGEEAGYDVFGDYSVVTAPYSDGVHTVGVLGVIGPTRMAYERVIPIVDVTARMLSTALSI